MSSKKIEKLPPLEHGLLAALKALDQQVAREMQRSPAQREAHGVQKWEPYNKRIESVASTIMDAFADNEITLDSAAKRQTIDGHDLVTIGFTMRARCNNLSEAVIDAGHWVAQERPAEVNGLLARWLATKVTQTWPGPALA